MVIGTAGHVDHGKTTLIKMITGIETDRLKEEKKRNLTIDLGYAFLGDSIAFIDVPGHEKFIKNMVAGATTIDFAMLVIAADDGIMPQTIEHFEILNLLGIEQGIIVLTKCDTVIRKLITQRKREIKNYFKNTFLEGATIFESNGIKDENTKKLTDYLQSLPMSRNFKKSHNPFRMPIDRAFSIAGHGTVVTGTVLSGQANTDEQNLAIFPEKLPVLVRNLQRGHRPVEMVQARQRCAINLKNMAKKDFYRGQIIADKNCFTTTKVITCRFSKLESVDKIGYGEKVRFHVNTGIQLATIRMIGQDTIEDKGRYIVQFDVDKPISVGFLDRFIVRRLSPKKTIGGGEIVDINAPKIKKRSRHLVAHYDAISGSDFRNNCLLFLKIYIRLPRTEMALKLSVFKTILSPVIEKLAKEGKCLIIENQLFDHDYAVMVRDKIFQEIQRVTPYKLIKKGNLLAKFKNNYTGTEEILSKMIIDNRLVQKYDIVGIPEILANQFHETHNARVIRRFILKKEFSLITVTQLQKETSIEAEELQNILDYLKIHNKLVLLKEGYIFHQELIRKAEELINNLLKKQGSARVTEIKKLLKTTRRFVIPILNYFDQYLLIREGDYRKLKRQGK